MILNNCPHNLITLAVIPMLAAFTASAIEVIVFGPAPMLTV